MEPRDAVQRVRPGRDTQRVTRPGFGLDAASAVGRNAAAPDVRATQRSDRAERASASEATRTPTQLSEEEKREVARLKARDREVRAHENAHKAAAGPHAQGAPKYSYTTGPDGKQYATGGSVAIDTSEVPNDPEKTLAKMEQVRAAALAPAEPSAQDARVAAEAAQKAAKARQVILQEKLSAREGEDEGGAASSRTIAQAYATPERAARIDLRV